MENKINIACFKEGSRTAEVKDIWQWDYGQILRIQGLNLPTAVEIHFSLDEHGGEAVRRIGITKDGVTDVPIPDSMVENESAYGDSYYFFAYIYLTDETSGNTEYKIRAKVSTRSKPEGYLSGGNDTFAAILKTVNEIADDKVTRPLIAKVGQVLSVKATDESGKPTEFEATDQGGGVSDEKIAEAVGTYMEAHPIEESDPTVPQWAKQPEKPTYTALEVGADASGTAVAKVSEHNTASNAHNDIRLLVQGLTTRLNALADSDDTTLDQMSEVVAYIKSNKSLIDAITTSKVNVSDIIDNLTTNVSNKPLSAAQGVKLKALIDAIAVPTKLSELENDSGYAKTTDIPDKLPNPQKLTFAGAVTAEYDGSGAVTVTIPEGSGGTGLSTEAINKLEEVGNYLAYTTADGGSKWTELIAILRNGSSGSGSGETVTLQSISATYSGSDVAVGTALTDLTDITVTAHYSDGSTANVTDYTLSGEIAEGSNTITVSYGGKTTTFTVTGVAEVNYVELSNSADLWEIGGVQPQGTAQTNTARLRTIATLSDDVKKISVDDGYSYILVVYSEAQTEVPTATNTVLLTGKGYYNPNGISGDVSATNAFLVSSGTYFNGELLISEVRANINSMYGNTDGDRAHFRILLKNNDNTTLTADDGLHIHLWG